VAAPQQGQQQGQGPGRALQAAAVRAAPVSPPRPASHPDPSAPPAPRLCPPAPRPQDIYAVFPSQPSVTKMDDRGGKWSWDDGGSGADEAPAPQWNPRTGFMKTRAQVEAEERAAGEAPAAAAPAASSGGSGSGDSSSTTTSSNSTSSSRGANQAAATSSSGSPGVPAASAASAPPATPAPPGPAAPLPAVGRGQVIGSCVGTTVALGVMAAVIRAYADTSAAAVLGTDPALLQRLLRLPAGFESPADAGVALAAAAAVTSARLLLLPRWPALAEATEASNRQVLAPLGWPDVVLVSALAGASEEILFRGALIPATFPDWRGAALSAALFGVLHNSGGRNAAFAAWAGGVGALYGAAYLYTGNIWVAAGAHALANFASAAVWKSRNGGGAQGAP
jgi:membrane protease YdiL (CAAX protease family)